MTSSENVIRGELRGAAETLPDLSFTEYIFNKMNETAGDSTALICGLTGEELSYAKTLQLIRELAFGWQSAGLQKGDVVCCISPNCLEMPIAMIAVTAAGGVFSPLNPLCPFEELIKQLDITEAKWIVAHPLVAEQAGDALKLLQDILNGVFILSRDGKEFDGAPQLFSLCRKPSSDWSFAIQEPDEVILLPFSSGTTGPSKAVQLTSKNFRTVFESYNLYTHDRQFDDRDTMLGILPFFHTLGLTQIFGPLLHGAKLVILPRFIPEHFLNAIQKYKITFIMLVPTLLRFMVTSPLAAKADFSSVNIVFSGGATLLQGLYDLFKKRMPNAYLLLGYGMTEATLATHTTSPNSFKEFSVGNVVPYCEAKVKCLKTGRNLPAGEIGEICAKGSMLTKGYLHNDEATADLYDNEGWMQTGDIGYFDQTGEFFLTDRKKDLIKYKAHQVAPVEIEAILTRHSNVADAAVVGVQDEEAGELPKAFVVLQEGAQISENEIINWVAERVAPQQKLRAGVEFVDEIPKSPIGKILRRILREKANAKQ